MPIMGLTACLGDMLPDILCKCKARCTFIGFVQRSPDSAQGASRQLKRNQAFAYHLLTKDYGE